jgi:hypothetical protein
MLGLRLLWIIGDGIADYHLMVFITIDNKPEIPFRAYLTRSSQLATSPGRV